MKQQVKILLAIEPEEFRKRLKALIQQQTDMKVVGEVLDPIELLLKVNETQADIVVLTLPEPGSEPGIITHLFAEFPQVLVLAISSVCEEAFLFQQIISREQLPGKSGEDVLVALRRAKDKYLWCGEGNFD
ncbi:MAG TPA: hypothetical protein VHT73_00390 [Thermodesulfobacteriota bacterium]|nr:hypothetical protein [Thermodesulfobacteriota bacterium]